MEANSMKNNNVSFFRRAIKDESGQVLMPWVAVVMMSFLGISGLVMDVGRAYVAHSQLQNTARAAALAAAGEVYNTSTTSDAYATATTYSGTSGDKNASGVGTLTTTVSEGCVNTLMATGTSCSSTSVKNAVQVTETTTVRNFIMPIFWGSKTTTISATATASMQGLSQPWNVAIVLDATDSMVTNSDNNCSTGTATRFTCALESIQTLLEVINPCATGATSCATSNANFRVALFAFPNVTVATRPDDYGCNGTIPTPAVYSLPEPGLSGYSALTYNGTQSTYEVTLPSTGNADANGFLSDYYSSTATNNMNSSSEIVEAIGGSSGCTQMNTAGGESTYYAGVIYAAQDALKAEQALHPKSNNAMILISDGEATAANTNFPPTGAAATPSGKGYSVVTNSTSNTKNLVNAAFGTYPDFNDQCQQAIVAAQAAATAGTRVYAVAYGSESSGCTTAGGGTDSTLVATGNNQSFTLTGSSALTPCVTMENIASSLAYFYSDYNQSGSGSTCTDNSHTTVNLSDISLSIASTFTRPRLLPNSAFLYPVVQTS
jgi:Flp pilus assembly protein TadG